jgi:flavin reductase (DIM6/NTAB) family NADH-FMN oxidoreductase RutF
MTKVDVRPEWWDNIFSPSSCLAIITTVDKAGQVNAAAYGTCTRICHDPMYISFTSAYTASLRADPRRC